MLSRQKSPRSPQDAAAAVGFEGTIAQLRSHMDFAICGIEVGIGKEHADTCRHVSPEARLTHHLFPLSHK